MLDKCKIQECTATNTTTGIWGLKGREGSIGGDGQKVTSQD